MKGKKGFEMSFSWMFAIIVGAVILIIAVYAASKFVSLSRTQTDTAVAAQLNVLLNPVETSLESGRYMQIDFSSETRLLNRCSTIGNFGEQGIRTAAKRGIGEEWQEPGFETIFYNKYLFSSEIEQGEKLHVFVKPFEFPYKIADLIYLTAKDYCFVNPPQNIEGEISDLSITNINVTSSSANCPLQSVKVCFSQTGCDIVVNTVSKTVTKEGRSLTYSQDSLMYAAIFSGADLYECQIKRLMKRSGELAHIYADKSQMLSAEGCSVGLSQDLINFASASQVNSSLQLNTVSFLAEDLERKNEALTCKLY